ncbi:MAG: hypothetical protein JRI25_26035 [Deltaproteobacteria bacterium]|nr:hypothetical protein [Deltaproteobacteria bacterium]MBW2258041.1 hypothetical protein [Deltaproteobacteria bacterium]
MLDDTRLNEALELLGNLLADRNQPFEVLAIGGGALLLLGLSRRATADLDIVARRKRSGWTKSRPLPQELVQAVQDVARALGLETDKPWLNDGPSFLFEMGLPSGWESRTTMRQFGALTIELLGREDVIKLKLWAATDARAPERRARDVGDLRRLEPTRDDLLDALRWCAAKDGTTGFVQASGVLRILRKLGVVVDPNEEGQDNG